MSRKTKLKTNKGKEVVLSIKVDHTFANRVRTAAKNSDTDVSKLTRQSLREKLDRMLA